MASSPTTRTLELFRREGWTCGIVEKWNQHARIRQDVFGFGDVLAMKPGFSGLCVIEGVKMEIPVTGQIALLQACAGASHAARRSKVLAEPRAKTWLQSGGYIAVVSWAKRGAAGKRKLWTSRVEWLTVADVDAAALPMPEPLF